MKAFVFEDLDCVSDSYHSEGGLFIVAESIEKAKELVKQDDSILISDKEWDDVITYNLDTRIKSYSERVIVFPNAGCC